METTGRVWSVEVYAGSNLLLCLCGLISVFGAASGALVINAYRLYRALHGQFSFWLQKLLLCTSSYEASYHDVIQLYDCEIIYELD